MINVHEIIGIIGLRLLVEKTSINLNNSSFLHVPEEENSNINFGIIKVIGNGMKEDGSFVQLHDTFSINQTIIFNKYAGFEIKIFGKKYILVELKDVLSFFTKEQ